MRSNIQVLFLFFLFYETYGQEAYVTSRLESISKAIGSMNATIVDMQRTIAGIAKSKLEPIQRAQVEEEGWRKLVRELTDQLLLNPRAKLYTGLNYTGDFESYHLQAARKGGCYNLEKLSGKIKSVNTEGTCVRFFQGDSCSRWSQAVYPASSAAIDPKLEGARSVGPCVSNEFEYATLTMSGNPPVQTVNKRAEEVAAFANVPDLLPDFWRNPDGLRTLTNTEPILVYRLGQGGRLEGVWAEIYLRHILSPDVAEGNRIAGLDQSFFADLGMIPLTDEPGYVVPLELGGPAKEAYNVFAQDKGQAAKYRAILVPMIKKHLAEYPDGYVNLGVTLHYPDPDSASKRPAGVWYWVFKVGTLGIGEVAAYGYLPNVDLGLHG